MLEVSFIVAKKMGGGANVRQQVNKQKVINPYNETLLSIKKG